MSQMNQQYYFHNEFISNSCRKNICLIHMHNKKLLCMTNSNLLQIYEFTLSGLKYYSKHSFNCNIAKIQILPSKYKQIDDFVFIIDEKGRYGFWQADGGFQFIQNQIFDNRESLYRNIQEQQQNIIFTGQIHHDDVLDTKGTLFFSIKHRIILIDYTINRMGLKIQKTKSLNIPYIKYRFINWVGNGQSLKLLGIVEENEQRTILKVHNLANSPKLCTENLIFNFEKLNIIQFTSNQKELIVMTQDEASSILIGKGNQKLYTHSIHNNNGKVLYLLGNQKFCFLGDQLIVFGHNYYKSYGSLIYNNQRLLQDKGISQASYMMLSKDGNPLISLNTLNNETYIIQLLQDSWRMFFEVKGLNIIYSLHPISSNSAIVTMNSKIDCYEVLRIYKHNQAPLLKEQAYQNVIQRLFCVNNGQYIIICSKQTNSIAKYSHQDQEYNLIQFCLPAQNIICINQHAFTTENGVYKIHFQTSQLQMLIQQTIILSCMINETVYYSNFEGEIKTINIQTSEVNLIRNDGIDEYIWHCIGEDILVAKCNNRSQIFLYKSNESIDVINIAQDVMISSIHHHYTQQLSTIVIFGLINGNIYIYSLNGQQIKSITGYHLDPVKFFTISEQFLGVLIGDKHFILKLRQNYEIIPIQIIEKDHQARSIIYLPQRNRLMFVQSGQNLMTNLIRMIEFNKLVNPQTFNVESYRLQSICTHLPQIPTVYVNNDRIYVGLEGKLSIYSLLDFKQIVTNSHYIKDVLGIIVLQCGLVVYGIDQLSRNLIYVYSLEDHSEICYFNLILTENKYFKTIQALPNTNLFICRNQKYTTIYQMNCPIQIVPLHQIKTDSPGYHLQINDDSHLMVQTDSKRLIIVYSYKQRKIIPICRYIAQFEVNDILIMNNCLVYADKVGNINILELNCQNQNEPIRMMMTKVSTIKVGFQISTLAKVNHFSLLYATVSGQIGELRLINPTTFMIFKEKEELMFKEIEKSCDFNYQNWRNRIPAEDKLVDGLLIKKYIECYGNRLSRQEQKEAFKELNIMFRTISL